MDFKKRNTVTKTITLKEKTYNKIIWILDKLKLHNPDTFWSFSGMVDVLLTQHLNDNFEEFKREIKELERKKVFEQRYKRDNQNEL